MATIPNTIPVAGTFAPTDSTDTFPTSLAEYIKGGFRSVVNQVARLAIPYEHRTQVMLVLQNDNNTYWRLGADLTTWSQDLDVPSLSTRVMIIEQKLEALALSGLLDVAIVTPLDRQGLVYNGSTSKWENRPIVEASYNKVVTSDPLTLLPAVSGRVLRYVVPTGKISTMLRANCTADGLGIMTVVVNSVAVGTVQNSYLSPDMNFIQRIALSPGDVVDFNVENTTITFQTNSYVMWLYLLEEVQV